MMAQTKMNWQLRRSLKFRSRRWRRREVVIWSVMIGFIWLITIGEDHHGLSHFFNLTRPLLLALPLAYGKWRKERRPVVTTLEDRAQLEYGVSFEVLGEREQKEIMASYRPGICVMREPDDERVEMERLRAHETAFRILRRCFLIFAGFYVAGYLWLPSRPDQPMDPRGWLDPPVWIIGMVILVIVLPQAVWMWTEPDEVGEPRVVMQVREG